jgi:uncharacterized protein YegP (UPF0339 family)
MGEFVIRKVATGVKFDLLAGNGEIIATSEVYKTEAACRKGMESVCKNAQRAKLEDHTEGAVGLTCPKFELYQDKAGAYRFRLRSRNGAIVAASEAYSTKNGCLEGIESVRKNANFAENAIFYPNKY